ncbi:phospholipase A [Gilvimarinus polysaccharolyticus]|uniref:phospholipase A n=1 Tax=Gilvimarinus polysaccharolyticus TaxID=863921 RepID=UPI0006738D19|nr:phospholipase A [Gilvimarinus polysaccharolyticus]
MLLPRALWAASLALFASGALAAELTDSNTMPRYQSLEQCLKEQVAHAAPESSIAQLRESCRLLLVDTTSNTLHEQDIGVLNTRLRVEAISSANRFVLTPHNRTYVLPLNYSQHTNAAPFEEAAGKPTDLQNTEIDFQISLKVLIAQDLLHDNGNLYIAYTNRSLWQAYNSDISRPFRETNHEPELLFSATNDWQIFGFRNVLNQVGLVHQSNGQSGTLSRSWNRIRARSVFERGNLALAFAPWYRLPEKLEDDDNPDIEDYLGHYEITAAYAYKGHIIDTTTRRPFSDKGSVELGWSFPLRPTVRGYLKYFHGYGASLIDYNVETQSIGLGVVFSDLF